MNNNQRTENFMRLAGEFSPFQVEMIKDWLFRRSHLTEAQFQNAVLGMFHNPNQEQKRIQEALLKACSEPPCP